MGTQLQKSYDDADVNETAESVDIITVNVNKKSYDGAEELDNQLDEIFPCDCSFAKGFAYKKDEPCDGSCVLAPYRQKVKALIHSREIEAQKVSALREADLLNALGLMYGQYCSKKLGHDFMGAGEAAIDLLEIYGIHDENSEWTDKTYDRLDEAVKKLKEQTEGEGV